MSFWIAVALMSGVTLVLLAAPLWRKRTDDRDRSEYDLNVFKDQLHELERDLSRGLISEAEAETARVEIQRRILAADDNRKEVASQSGRLKTSTLAIWGVLAVGVIGGSFVMYGEYGSPGYRDMPFASRDIQQERVMANKGDDMSGEIGQLKARLDENPKDIDAWILLGRTLRTVGRNEEAMDAFRNAVKESDRHPAVLADYAEAKIYANEGTVDKETVGALMEALQSDPTQFKARFYYGYAKARVEDFHGAIQAWTDLIAMAPPQAPWLEQVNRQIKMAAQAGELDPADFKPSDQARVMGKQLTLEWEVEKGSRAEMAEAPHATGMAGPSQEDMQAAAEMTPDEREGMIRSMVQRLADRLEENPNDPAGWQRLVQVYTVLGETEKAADAKAKLDALQGS